jgi:hypothetical protein
MTTTSSSIDTVEYGSYMHQEEAGGGQGAELADAVWFRGIYDHSIIIIIYTACNTETLISFFHLIETSCSEFCSRRRT